MLRCRKTINSPKNSFWKKKKIAKSDLHTPAQLEQMTTTTITYLFPVLSVSKFKRFLLNLRHKTHG